MEELQIKQNDIQTLKYAAYYNQFASNRAQKGLMMKDIFYRRSVGVHYCKDKMNYQMDINQLEQFLEKDVQDGLIAFCYESTYGNTLTGAIDLTPELVKLCKKQKMWLNVNASYLGLRWICPQFRPDITLIKDADSLEINFSKLLLIDWPRLFNFVCEGQETTQQDFRRHQQIFFLRELILGQALSDRIH